MNDAFDKRPRRHRLSYRLLALFIITGIVLIAVISGVVRSAWDQRYRDAVDPHLRRYVEYILVDIGTPPNLDTAVQLSTELSVDIVINGPNVNWSSNGNALVENDNRALARHGAQFHGAVTPPTVSLKSLSIDCRLSLCRIC